MGNRDLKPDTPGLGVRIAFLGSGFVALGAGVGSLPMAGREEGAVRSTREDGVADRASDVGGNEALCRLSERDDDDKLLWMMGRGRPNCDWRSGVPSRLGLIGGAALGEATGWEG
jgi:hypothetical protein